MIAYYRRHVAEAPPPCSSPQFSSNLRHPKVYNRISMTCSKITPKSCRQTIVFKCAVVSRLLLLTLILLWRTLLTPFDTSVPLNLDCLSHSTQQQVLWPSLTSALESSIVLDGVYFVRSNHMPSCPSFLFAFRCYPEQYPEAALRASILLCFNAASIFYSSVYSESLYALFSVVGLYHLKLGKNSIAIAIFWLALSASARSKGVLSAGASHFCWFVEKACFFGNAGCCCWSYVFFSIDCFSSIWILGNFPDKMRPCCKAQMPFL